MALPLSGPLSLSQIQAEFGGSNPISLSEYYRGGPYTTPNNTNVPTSGAISISNFYGATRQFAFTISSNQTNANLRTLAINAGWDQSAPVVATISGGVYCSSNSTGTPGLTISGSFPGGVSLINNGLIIGMGGAGGSANPAGAPVAGSTGGLALSVSSAVTITNNGTIGGGGGGGGGGVTVFDSSGFCGGGPGGSGGGGRTGTTNSAGGVGGWQNGSPGTSAGGGAGGLGLLYATGPQGEYRGGYGGAGGGWGAAGGNGGNGGGFGGNGDLGGGGYYTLYSGAVGGSGGGAVSGNSNITWVAFGTRLGSIS